MKQCPFCPCQFETESDYNLHMETFGWNKEEHMYKFRNVHRQMEGDYWD
jgi:uncharacterized C2H2 Zn-finger protein